jgi:hypothetical protein
MRGFDLGRTFDLVFTAANSLLHLHEVVDLLSCFRSVRAHLAPGSSSMCSTRTFASSPMPTALDALATPCRS